MPGIVPGEVRPWPSGRSGFISQSESGDVLSAATVIVPRAVS